VETALNQLQREGPSWLSVGGVTGNGAGRRWSTPRQLQQRRWCTPGPRSGQSKLGVGPESLRGSGPHGAIQAETWSGASGKPLKRAPGYRKAAVLRTCRPLRWQATEPRRGQAGAAPLGQAFGAARRDRGLQHPRAAVDPQMAAQPTGPCSTSATRSPHDRFESFYKAGEGQGGHRRPLLAKAVAVVPWLAILRPMRLREAGMAYPGSVNVAVGGGMDDGGLLTPVFGQRRQKRLYSLFAQLADLVARVPPPNSSSQPSTSTAPSNPPTGMYGVDRFDAILPRAPAPSWLWRLRGPAWWRPATGSSR